IRISDFPLYDLCREADDLKKAAVAQLAGDGAEDARAARVLVFLVQDHHRVAVEADVAAVVAARGALDAHHYALDDFARLDVAAGDRLLHAGDDDVAQAGVAALVAAQHLDTHALFGAGVIGDVQIRIHLNHGDSCFPDPTVLPQAKRPVPYLHPATSVSDR